MPPLTGFAFGPFELDPRGKRLLKDREPIALSSRQFDLLHALVSNAGTVISKDHLIQVGWRDVAVSDNSLEQAVSALRRVLGGTSAEYIKTESRRGYCFTAAVTRTVARESDADLDALLAPHRAWIEGRAALETLERDGIARARGVFESVLERMPEQASVHVGLANACALQFEMTRADQTPDVAALEKATHHAREACRLDAGYGEAWATLGFVLDRTGRHADALAAARRSTSLEPDNWRHHLRIAYTAWGEERLRAARRTLTLLPGFPMAHWLAATVHVARGSLTEAERELDAGIACQDADVNSSGRFSSVALHWLRGLIYLAGGDDRRAIESFERELSTESGGHLYARECCANTWYAIGAHHLACGRADAATHAFEETLMRVARHPLARVALAVVQNTALPQETASGPSFDAALAQAAAGFLDRSRDSSARIQQAARLIESALAHAAHANDGWLLPVEPLFRVYTAPDAWAAVLARIRARAA